jgi:acyl dehydratase
MSTDLSLFKAGDRYEHAITVTSRLMDDFMALSGDENPMLAIRHLQARAASRV